MTLKGFNCLVAATSSGVVAVRGMASRVTNEEAPLLGHSDERVARNDAASPMALAAVATSLGTTSTVAVGDVSVVAGANAGLDSMVSRRGPSVEHLVVVGAARPVVSTTLVLEQTGDAPAVADEPGPELGTSTPSASAAVVVSPWLTVTAPVGTAEVINGDAFLLLIISKILSNFRSILSFSS
jgi:hypothetical protein